MGDPISTQQYMGQCPSFPVCIWLHCHLAVNLPLGSYEEGKDEYFVFQYFNKLPAVMLGIDLMVTKIWEENGVMGDLFVQ